LTTGCGSSGASPGWQSVNPFDDARAAVLEIDNGLGTREEYTAAKGDDWEDIDEQNEREAKSETDRGLIYGAAPQPTPGRASRRRPINNPTAQKQGAKRA
jgi:capsid protein